MRILTGRDLALAVKSARLAVGLTQQDLADAAGVSRQWVVNLESQRSNPGILSVLTVLSALSLSMQVAASDDPGVDGAIDGVDLDALLERHTADDG